MFYRWGNFISHYWGVVVLGWLALFVVLRLTAPHFDDVAKGGEFVFLPEKMPSRQGELLRDRAFPARRATSSMVIVVTREEQSGLTDDDRSFITETLIPTIETIRDRINKGRAKTRKAIPSLETNDNGLIARIHSFAETGIGELLVSQDGMASLVMVELASDFQDGRNWQAIHEVENSLNTLRVGGKMPPGLELALTGDATLGRDLSQAEASSARNIGPLTILLVVILLAAIYRAPLLALVTSTLEGVVTPSVLRTSLITRQAC